MSEVKVKVHPSLDDLYKENILFRQLVKDFKQYKSGEFVSYFGRDTSYDFPHSIRDSGLLHIHILHESSKAYQRLQKATRNNWYIDQYDLRCDMGDPANDKALIYAQGYLNENIYMILEFFSANAHQMARHTPKMRELAQMAREFRDLY